MGQDAILLYAASEQDADMLYFSGVMVPDPFVGMQVGRKKIGVVSPLEFSRVSKTSTLDVVLDLSTFSSPKPEAVVADLCKQYNVSSLTVGRNFPLGLAEAIRRVRGVSLKACDHKLFARREAKSAEEAKFIAQGNRASAAGIRAIEKILRASKIAGNRIMYQNKALTSEFLRAEAEKACVELGAIPSGTIVASGNQACDPHERGFGLIRPNELIIVDIFPKVAKTGYHGDMTRTFLKGRASQAQRRLVRAVHDAQKLAISQIKSGVNGKKMYGLVADYFKQLGYETGQTKRGYEGFFHGLGHGLGLEVHEAPNMGSVDMRIRKGAVVTVEPGLYYPGLGGCRIEDVVWVQEDSCELLSNCHYRWEIR